MHKRARGRPKHDDVLTPAEWRVVQAVRHGLTNAKIARLRGISLDAVKFHVGNAIDKLGLRDREQLKHWRGIPKFSLSGTRHMNHSIEIESLGQVSRTVRDISLSIEWYGTTLGLKHLYTFGKLAFFECGGTRLYLQEGESSGESILYLRVGDIHAAHSQLQSRGVEFTGAPHLIHKHNDGTEEWMAFFKDLEGRPLAIMSQVKP